MMVGYALDHTGDTYRMWNKATNGIHVTRDVIWLKRMYFEPPDVALDLDVPPLTTGDDDDLVIETGDDAPAESSGDDVVIEIPNDAEEDSDEDSDDEDKTKGVTTRSGRAINRPARFVDEIGATTMDSLDYEIKLSDAENNYYEKMGELHEGDFIAGEVCCVGAGTGGGFVNTKELKPMKFKEAMATDDEPQWETAVVEEHK
jgi:hypothetical protein